MSAIFADFDLEHFWEPSDYALREYVGAAVTDAMVEDIERRLGFTLPRSYVELMRVQNGGIPRRKRHRTTERTTWAEDHVAIAGLFSIGSDKRHSLCGEHGSQFWSAEWSYPEIGVYFADCPSAGHDMLCLDYRACGPGGEPAVVHVDQEWNYRIVTVAPTFEAFIRGLEDASAFDIEA